MVPMKRQGVRRKGSARPTLPHVPYRSTSDSRDDHIRGGGSSRGPLEPFPISNERWSAVASRFRLAPRELEIVRCICAGLSEREMAVELGLRLGTAHSYVERVRLKLQVRNKAAVVARVFLALDAE